MARSHIYVLNYHRTASFHTVNLNADVTFELAEVDMDAAKSHVDRSSTEGINTHKGRLFLYRERATGKTKLITLDDLDVPQVNGRLPPESNAEIQADIVRTMGPGSIACGDGSQAMKSSAKAASVEHGELIPFCYAQHGRKPVKQFTRFWKIPKQDVGPELERIMRQQGRWLEDSGSIKVTGGNQGAESCWGTSKSYQKSKATHRAGATKHSTAHGASGIFLSKNPGLAKLGEAMSSWFSEFLDCGPPVDVFGRSGWTGLGANNDADTTRIVLGGKWAKPPPEEDEEPTSKKPKK